MLRAVWPLPISLATTFGISVDYFSSPYLDVSVQAVPHAHLFDSVCVTTGLLWWVSPFGHPRIVAHLQLPEAFRSLSRPSSAPDAKAFPLRSYSLDLFVAQTSTRSVEASLVSACAVCIVWIRPTMLTSFTVENPLFWFSIVYYQKNYAGS